MSVIAKFDLRAVKPFGGEALYEMGLVCENDLMAMNAGANEDRLFTKASPWGEARMSVNIGAEFPQTMIGDKFYAILIREEEAGPSPEMPAAVFMACPARIASSTDFGGTSRQIEICSGDKVPAELALRRFTWRMSVDNPPAAEQLQAGTRDWMLYLFKAGDYTVQTALDAAHGNA